MKIIPTQKVSTYENIFRSRSLGPAFNPDRRACSLLTDCVAVDTGVILQNRNKICDKKTYCLIIIQHMIQVVLKLRLMKVIILAKMFNSFSESLYNIFQH